MTRKLALPKFRIAITRPAVVVWIFAASSTSAAAAPWASPSSATVFVRVKAFGYGVTPRRWSSSKFARRWRSWSDSFCWSVCSCSVIACCYTYRRLITELTKARRHKANYINILSSCLRALATFVESRRPVSLSVQGLPDSVQDTVDERHRLLAAERPREEPVPFING